MTCPALGEAILRGEPLEKLYKLTVAWMSDGDPSVLRTLTVMVHGSWACCASAAEPENTQTTHNARKIRRKPALDRVGENRTMGSLRRRTAYWCSKRMGDQSQLVRCPRHRLYSS